MSAVTLLWFGAEAYALVGTELLSVAVPEQGEPAAALAEFVCALSPSPKCVDLIYQPGGLDPIRASCPRGARAVLAKTLARDFPAVSHPSTSWATLTPRAYEGAYTTLLFLESRPRIPRLAAALAERGVTLRGAWPLPALLETIPPFNTPDTTGIFLVTTTSTALVFALLPNASRSVTLVNDVAAPATILLALNTALTFFDRDSPPPVHVVCFGEPWPLGDQFAGIAPVLHDLGAILERSQLLAAKAASNFAPPDASFPWNRLLQLASVLMLGFAVSTVAIYQHDLRALQADRTRRAAIADDERQQIALLRQNREATYAALAFAAEVPGTDRAVARLVDVLAKSTPNAVTIHSLTLADGAFTIEGTVHDGSSPIKGPLADLHATLARKDQPWTLLEQTRGNAGTAGFVIAGAFREAATP